MWRNEVSSVVTKDEWKYPLPTPFRRTTLDTADGHEISVEEYGNPDGQAVLFIHGGPGGATSPANVRYFDPKRYRVFLVDQRGVGKSRPCASSSDHDEVMAALTNNTTRHSISDFEKLRKLNNVDKWTLFGGSWGSCLALCYAILHPDVVENLVLRGIFLCRRHDLQWFYQGNAATFEKNEYDMTQPGAYQFFHEPWALFVKNIPQEKRHDMIAAYAEVFAMRPSNAEEKAYQDKCAVGWSVWEGCTSYLSQDLSDVGRFAEPEFAKAFAKIENHYFTHDIFMGENGRPQNFVIENVDKIKHIPIYITHGRYDMVCPLFAADELVAKLKAAGATKVDYRVTNAGHSATCRENWLQLIDFMDNLPSTTK